MMLPPTRDLSQTDGAGLYACRCGANAALCQWRDTLKPNATWVECTNPDCGMTTDSYQHDDAEQAKAEVVRRWNRVMKP